ncbi:MAG: hemin uptake protein HemP [Planctomycetes bacterium]|nr:hemin uptake protein HemP [Planctomycetota bacterium]
MVRYASLSTRWTELSGNRSARGPAESPPVSSEDRQPESDDRTPRTESVEQGHAGSPPTGPAGQDRPRQWHSETLLAGFDEARIIHGDETYRLCRTRNGKLILVK